MAYCKKYLCLALLCTVMGTISIRAEDTFKVSKEVWKIIDATVQTPTTFDYNSTTFDHSNPTNELVKILNNMAVYFEKIFQDGFKGSDAIVGLVKLGANPNIHIKHAVHGAVIRVSPLAALILMGNVHGVQELINKGADVNQMFCEKANMTLLNFAFNAVHKCKTFKEDNLFAKGNLQIYEEIISLLINNGAKLHPDSIKPTLELLRREKSGPVASSIDFRLCPKLKDYFEMALGEKI